jgi:hypothetical protein
VNAKLRTVRRLGVAPARLGWRWLDDRLDEVFGPPRPPEGNVSRRSKPRLVRRERTMSTPETTQEPRSAPPLVGVAAVIVAIAAIFAAFSVGRIASADHYSACVSAQVARYPAVGVSAFNTKQTGPIKLAYDVERRAAVDKC